MPKMSDDKVREFWGGGDYNYNLRTTRPDAADLDNWFHLVEYAEYDKLRSRVAELEAMCEKLADCLRFYGDKNNYLNGSVGDVRWPEKAGERKHIILDLGNLAKSALAEYNKMKEGIE